MSDYILPDRLHPGQKLVTKTGSVVTVVSTSLKSDDGEPMIRLRFKSGIVGHKLWTRDDLQQEGVTEYGDGVDGYLCLGKGNKAGEKREEHE